MSVEFISSGPVHAAGSLLLAHGAGVDASSPFMEAIANDLSDRDWRVHRFDFPYMLKRRLTGRTSLPDRPDVFARFSDTIEQLNPVQPLVIGGKSMGGRIASLLLDELHDISAVAAGICLGYPFHPLGKPAQLRTQHLVEMTAPCLIVQGERDAMGRVEEVPGYGLSSAVSLQWIPDGDHSFTPRKRSGRTEEQNMDLVIDHVHEFLHSVCC